MPVAAPVDSPAPLAPDAPFVPDLLAAVDARLDPATLTAARRALHRKALVVGAWYLASFATAVAGSGWVAWAACVSLGLAMAAVGFNVQHDANHNAFFASGGSKRLTFANRAAGWSMYALGASQKRWIDGHVYTHHSATNIVGRDYDIELAPFARLAPQQRWRPWHRAQHLYLWVLYAFTAVSILVADVTSTIAESFTGDRNGNKPTVREYAVLLVTKATFCAVMLGVPLTTHTGWSVLVGAGVVMAVCGVTLGVVFQLAHVTAEASFRPADERPPCGWHEWQLASTVDFCGGNGPVSRAVTWFVGGLNYQAEHHLFPQVPHTAYPAVAEVVGEVCARHGVTRHAHVTLRAAVASHFRHVRALGRPTTA